MKRTLFGDFTPNVLLAIAGGLVLCACGKTANGGRSDNDAQSHNQLPVEKADEKILPLPDTAFDNASVVKYSIEVLDTAVDGHLSNLRDLYSDVPGVFTFRGGLMRRADFGGKLLQAPTKLTIDWEYTTLTDQRETGYGSWGGGTGWTGQPLHVQWPDSCITRFRNAGVVNSNFTGNEIIVGSLSSYLYFLDFNSGKPTREPLAVENPIKGTISLDPTLNGNLYVGHGVPAQKPWGARVVDLYKHQITTRFNEDPKAQRRWFAFDSSPLHVGQFVFRPGENGSLYKCTVTPGELKIHSVLRYTVGGSAPGIESSMAVYRNYGYIADNHGNIIAINLDTLKPVWRTTMGDDTDATPVVMVEDGQPFVYVGCEIDRNPTGTAKFIKVNGLNGQVVWTCITQGKRVDSNGKHFDGGFYSSALPGTGNCSHLIFANCVNNDKGQNGELVAMNRKDGTVLYRLPLRYYSWSSPVGFTAPGDEMYIVTGDASGNLYLINALEGKIIQRLPVGSNFESSPVVVGSSLVVGSRGNKIYKVTVS